MNDTEHVVEVVTDEDGCRYRAECSCGWASEWFPYDDEAEWAGEDHREVVTDPGPVSAVQERPEGFDGFMSGLLDLQDDLVAASLWLVEHWSADLPVPSWSAGGIDYDHERPVMTVRAYCSNGADLDRAADLLGVELVDEPEADSYGNRYRRACRRFGRVEVEAYSALATTCTECGTEFTGAHCPACYDPPEATRTLLTANELARPEAGAA